MFINAQNEIRRTNEIIKTIINEPNHELQLTDPQEALKQLRSGKGMDGKSTRAYAPNGILTSNGQEEVQSGFIWAPAEIQNIRFTCKSNVAITPVYTCKAYSSGMWRSITAVGTIATNTIVDVPLYVANDYVREAFQTTDSNGGRANYEGIR